MSWTSPLPSTHTITSRWIFPVEGPPLANGIVAIRGNRIVAVTPHGKQTADEDLGNVAVIPGLVNAHTHLDLSGSAGLIPPTDPDHFTDWLRGVIAYRRTRTAEQVRADIESGLSECLRFGTTLVGDISAGGESWDALAAAKLRAVVFREMIGLSAERAEAARASADEWRQQHPATTTGRPALSPHSPYSARKSLLLAGDPDETVAIHLAESPGEVELVQSRSGPFVSFLQQLGAWDESGLVASFDEILIANRAARRALFVHCNYLDPIAGKYFHSGMSIAYCPRTHAAFEHPEHPFREFLRRNVRVCIGTDSLASNPDLNVLSEVRFLHGRHPQISGAELLRMATLSGAEALGWGHVCGSLTPGKSADLVAVPLPDRDGDPYELLLAEDSGERRTLFCGGWREPHP